MPAQNQGTATPTTGSQLEFRGVMAMNDGTMFNITDLAKKSGTWVKLNESGYDFAVKKYDPDTDTVTVGYQGQTLTLAMRTPKIASMGNAAAPPPMPMPGAMANVPRNPVTQNVTATPTPATEAARLADWQAEIQRRRDMRAQAASQPTPATPQPVPQVMPQPVQPQAQPGNVAPRTNGQQRQLRTRPSN